MENLIKVLIPFTLLLFVTSCSSDNECDNECPAGTVQLLDCSCIDPNPTDPCVGITCPQGQVLNADCECVDEGQPETTIKVSSNITSDVTWTSGQTVILAGRIAVEPGATLTIEPGTCIKGEFGAGANSSALIIARGAKINACGTASAPIIMTTVADEITPEMIAAGNFVSPNMEADVNGLWGGLIVLGNAPISIEGDMPNAQIEGIPTSDSNGTYGGSDEDDNSGSMCYISIRHGGTNIGEGNEINGLTLGGVGSGTTINNIEVVANQDDGIEWFGGTVSAENVLVWNCADDGLDTDQAWNGSCNNWIVALPQGGSAMELDGPEGSLTQGCNSFTNGAIYCGSAIDHIIDWDDDTNTGITNLYIFGVDSAYGAEAGIESFGGDGNCTSGSWEYTVPAGYDVSTLLSGAIAAGEATEVSMNGNGIGPDASVFGWTLGGQSGTLSSIGL